MCVQHKLQQNCYITVVFNVTPCAGTCNNFHNRLLLLVEALGLGHSAQVMWMGWASPTVLAP